MRVVLLVLTIMLIPGMVLAGAWPRKEAEVYLSFSTHLNVDDLGTLRQTQELYGEYGFSSTITVVIDAYQSVETSDGRVVASLQRAISPPESRHKYSLSFGIGYDTVLNQQVFRIGGAWGIGTDRHWINLDARTDFIDHYRPETKIETTLGLHFASGDLGLFRITAEHLPMQSNQLWLSPGYVWRLNDHIQIEMSLAKEAISGSQQRLKIGLWTTF